MTIETRANRRAVKREVRYAQPGTGSFQHVLEVANTIGKEAKRAKMDTIFKPESFHTKASMLRPDSNAKGETIGLTKEFFGAAGLWKAVMNDPEKAAKREEEKEKRYMDSQKFKSNREKNLKLREYKDDRKAQLERFGQRAERRITNHFYDVAVPHKFGVSRDEAQSFVNTQMQDAVDTMTYVHKAVFPDQALPIRNETAMEMTSPAAILDLITQPSTDKILSEQLKQELILAHTAAEVSSLNLDREADRTLARIQQVLDKDLFAGKTGFAVSRVVRSLFTNDTNRLMHIEGVHGPLPKVQENMHIKECALDMRPIRPEDSSLPKETITKDMLWVYVNPDVKKPKSYTAKAVKKALSRYEKGYPDTINMKAKEMTWLPNGHKDKTDDVTDTHRIKFVIPGTSNDVLTTLDRVYDILVDPKNQAALAKKDRYGKPILDDEATVVKDIFDDSQINGDKNQSSEVKFKRIQVTFDQLELPIEIIFQTMDEFLTETYLTGSGNITDRTPAGHELYLIKRNRDVARVLFDARVYDNPIYKDVDTVAAAAYKRKAEELKARKKVNFSR